MVGWHHQLNGHEFEQALGSPHLGGNVGLNARKRSILWFQSFEGEGSTYVFVYGDIKPQSLWIYAKTGQMDRLLKPKVLDFPGGPVVRNPLAAGQLAHVPQLLSPSTANAEAHVPRACTPPQ